MPTYDYVCQACDHAFEEFQSMTAKPLRKCPQCGKLKLKRLIGTGAGIIFKGSGFYETDYRSDSYQKSADADKKSADTKTTDKSDSKTDAKSTDSGSKTSDASTKSDSKPAAAKDKPASGSSTSKSASSNSSKKK